MKLTHINVSNRNIPSFAYLICEDNGKYFAPIFDSDNTVLDFRPVCCKTTPLIKVAVEQQINIEKNDCGLFAYYSVDKILIGDAEELVIQLFELSKKQDIHENRLEKFAAFAKKYDVFEVYLNEYYKHYGFSNGIVKLLAHAVTDNADIFANTCAIKIWKMLQKQRPNENDTIYLNCTGEGKIRASFCQAPFNVNVVSPGSLLPWKSQAPKNQRTSKFSVFNLVLKTV